MPSGTRSVCFNWVRSIGLILIASSIVFDIKTSINIEEELVGNVDWPYQIQANAANVSSIYHQNQKIGTISLLCPNRNCDIVKPDTNLECPNINGPTVVRKGSVLNLFVSGHRGGTTIRRFEATSPEGPWQEAKLELPSFVKCAAGLHSPDVFLFHGTYYMFAHHHRCRDVKGKQPTIVLTSSDLAHWELPMKAYAAKEYLYTRVFLHNNVSMLLPSLKKIGWDP
jgi:hypothetical protein